MGLFDKIRLGSALKSVGHALRSLHNKAVTGIKNLNPLVRMYYDSNLGSPIEGEVEKAFAASTCDTLKKFCPDWKWAKNACNTVGTWIAHKAVQALDSSKVIYQASNGIISPDRAYSEIAKRTTAGLFSVGKVLCRAGHWVGTLTSKISDHILPEGVNNLVKKGVDLVVGESLRSIRKNIFTEKNKERVTKFVEKGMRVAVTVTSNIIHTVDKIIDKAPEVAKKTINFIEKTAEKIGEKAEQFVDKVVDTAKNIGGKIVEGGKKLWNWLRGK